MGLTTQSGSTPTCGAGCEPQPPRAGSPLDGSRRAAPLRTTRRAGSTSGTASVMRLRTLLRGARPRPARPPAFGG
eukprot:2443687-Lingulodinium_polyedra.AAC.1